MAGMDVRTVPCGRDTIKHSAIRAIDREEQILTRVVHSELSVQPNRKGVHSRCSPVNYGRQLHGLRDLQAAIALELCSVVGFSPLTDVSML